MTEILSQITSKRTQDITTKGFNFGYTLPDRRQHPLVKPKLDSMLFIAEIKRASPSVGDIGQIPSPIALANEYLNGGAGAISVLCEERYFKGSLQDLMNVKSAYPNACILRKDFIQYIDEIEVSYRAGADMVLLIAAMFIEQNDGFTQLQNLYNECLRFGLTPLLEVHNEEELKFVAPLKATLLGINSRNLHTFKIDIPAACKLKNLIPQDTKVIFESGLSSDSQGFMIGSLGFNGVLCGSYLIQHTHPIQAIQTLKNAIKHGHNKKPRFYKNLFSAFPDSQSNHLHAKMPLLKICGITNLDDALALAQYPIQMLGFIMVKQSPRFVESKKIQEIAKALQTLYPHILRIAVVNDDKQSLQNAKQLLDQGFIDALQLHGLKSESPHTFAQTNLKNALFCFYPVQNIQSPQDFNPAYEGAFCLLDSQSAQGGGSGQSIDFSTLQVLKESYLCIAGGINPENIHQFAKLHPALLDINSGIEKSVGKKDSQKLRQLLENLQKAQSNN